MMTTMNDLNVSTLTNTQLFASLGLLATAASKRLPIPALDRLNAKIQELHAEIARRGLKATHVEFGPDESSIQAIIRASKKVQPAAPKQPRVTRAQARAELVESRKPVAAAEPPKPAVRGSHANCSHPATKAARAACRKAR